MTLEEQLEGAKSVAVSGHVRPDGDCVGSTLAVYNYIKEYYPGIQADIFLEEIPNVFRFLKRSEEINSHYDKTGPYDLFIALDCGDIGRLGKGAAYFETAKRTLCIDHHVSNASFADANYIFPDMSSASELVYELMDEEKITREIAECLYVGIVHDTGVFQYASTTSKTMNIAGHLMDKGIAFSEIVDKTYYEKTYEQNRILGKTLVESKRYLDGRCIVGIVTQRDMEEYQVQPKHLDGIVQQLRITKGVDVSIFLYENRDGSYKVSMRSGKLVDVASLLMKYGGGGHVRAAGATMKQQPEELIPMLVADVEEQLRG